MSTERRDPDLDQREAPDERIDETSYGASAGESGGVYNDDGPTAVNVDGDTMGTRDEAEPGEEPSSDPYSG